ncbi:uncharacterized protein LOC131654987 [Vicia villosa]|uniref:uncharacterized protein LOC131654987 n=1 Tax=Vicia villosa TaxID=3911 RepID=UPI00273B6C5B|nr:uncharacterized protein LOC131654987 [Vicia villosa]
MGSVTLHKHKPERFNKVQKHSNLRKITDLLRYVEMCVVLVLISRLSFQQLPLALKNYSEYFRGFAVSPGFVFMIGNVIIITLVAQSGHFSNDSSKTKSSEHDLYLEFLQNSNVYQRIQGCDQRKLGVKVESNVKTRSVVKVSEKDEQGMDLEVKEYRRCQSEIELVRGVDSDNEKEQKVLLRCESENEKRKNGSIQVEKEKKMMVKNLSLYPEDGMSNDEFRRTVEAFIARQQKLR